jgi:4-amino-4-deoxy-L-arabinose transferase-like glycosyltransferase
MPRALVRQPYQRLIRLALVILLAEICFLFFLRQINLDEGWYLWASKLVYEGKLPYRDFAFPQGPLLPYVYGAFLRLFGEGLYQGRLLTALLGCLSLLLGIRLARRLGGEQTVLIFLLLQITTVVALAFQYAYTATYALATCFLIASILCALSDLPETPRAVLTTVLWALATGTRLSIAVAIIPLALYLVITSRRRWRTALVTCATAILSLSLVFGPFLLQSQDVLFYNIFGFHTDRMPLAAQLRAMRRSLVRFVTDFPVPVMLGCVGLAIWAIKTCSTADRRRAWRHHLPEMMIGLVILSLVAAHLIPRTTDSYYNSLQMPLLNVLGALVLTWAWYHLASKPALRWVGAILLAGVVLLNGIQQVSALIRHNLVATPPQNQIELARDAAAFIARMTPPGSQILTFDTYLGLESGRRIAPGFEMSFFGYQPTWPTDRARTYRVVNNELLLEAMRGDMGAAAFTDYDLDFLYGDRELLLKTLYENFRWAKTIPGLGPYGDDLRIYLPPQFSAPAPQISQLTQLADGITFLGYDLENQTYQPGEPIRLTLYWQAQGEQRRSYTVFTHILRADGVQMAGWDNPPCRTTCPTDTWRQGEIIRDEYVVPTARDWQAGEYTIEIGMYDPDTGERLEVLEAPGQPVGDRITLGTVMNR